MLTTALLGGCRARAVHKAPARDTTGLPARFPLRRDSIDSLARAPRVVGDAAVVVFWLHAVDTLPSADQAALFDDLRYYTGLIAPALKVKGIGLLATRSDTLYIALPGNRRRTILLSGLDYPFGYVFVEPGGPERILTGVYPDDDLLDELRAYFDWSDDSAAVVPRTTT